MSPDHITAGAYNRDIDKRLTRKLVWLRETNQGHVTLCIRILSLTRGFEVFVYSCC